MKIPIQVTNNPELARRFGFTKRYRYVEMYVVGKWRPVGFYTEIQIANNQWRESAKTKLKVNANFTDKTIKEVVFDL